MNPFKKMVDTIHFKHIMTGLVVGLILFFLLRFLYRNWLQVSTYDFRFNYHYLVVSVMLLFGFFFLRVYCWQLILKKMGISLSLRKSVKVSFVSMIGKYLPGKVWLLLGKVYLSGKEGLPRMEVFASVVIEIVLEIVASIFFFFFFLLSVVQQPLLSMNVIISLGLIMVAGLVFLHPRVFYRLINMLLYWWKGETIKKVMGYGDTIQLLMFYNVIILLQGVAFYFFVNALCYVSVDSMLGLTGSLAIAGAVGTLSFFAPSGLGVREGVLALLLTSYVTSPIAVLISLLARLWVTLGEAICALFAWRL